MKALEEGKPFDALARALNTDGSSETPARTKWFGGSASEPRRDPYPSPSSRGDGTKSGAMERERQIVLAQQSLEMLVEWRFPPGDAVQFHELSSKGGGEDLTLHSVLLNIP